MLLFLIGIAVLVAGYHFYGRFIERILEPDGRTTPAKLCADGVDYVILPHWKNMLIQLLNIAGVGPVIGVILGIKFGPVVFLIIPIGNIIGGAVHDYVAGMMSLRHKGANLPALVRMATGKTVYGIFSVFMCLLLLLVVAVFINIPANLIRNLIAPGSTQALWIIIAIIFAYYIAATIFPVDKIIGAVYPIFGLMLLAGTLAIFASIIWDFSLHTPDMMLETQELKSLFGKFCESNPILPCLFVTIACGILSGFHATQSPIIARTMSSEFEARSSFYGMMIVEGIIAMVWSAAGFAFYNMFPEWFNEDSTKVLIEITKHFLGGWMGIMTVIAVVILAITSGDTAMRSLRLSLAEMFGIKQVKFANRIFLCLPIIAIVTGLLFWSNMGAESFKYLWNYFAWGNQVLASFTLVSVSVWLYSRRKPGWVTLLPGMFMTFIVTTFILWTSLEHKGPYGLGLDLHTSYIAGVVVALAVGAAAFVTGKRRIGMIPDDPEYIEAVKNGSEPSKPK